MKLKGLTVSVAQLSRIMARGEAIKRGEQNGDGGGGARSGRDGFISEAVLAETLHRYPGCTCESLGLSAGRRITDMIALGAGCTGSTVRDLDGEIVGHGQGWVCERLSAVRRAYGR